MEMTSKDGHMDGYAKPFLKDMKIMDLKKEKLTFPQKIKEGAATLAVVLLKNKKEKTTATRIPFSQNFGQTDVGVFLPWEVVSIISSLKLYAPDWTITLNPKKECVKNEVFIMKKTTNKKIRYGIVGLGSIAQVAVLPGFKSASRNSVVTAFISGDPLKLKKVGALYDVKNRYSYKQYDQFLNSGVADAVYIALPNNMHSEYSIRAAQAGLHVLCRKPMAGTVQECQSMISAANKNNVHLMIAYRLHFERANLDVIKILKSEELATLVFSTPFSLDKLRRAIAV